MYVYFVLRQCYLLKGWDFNKMYRIFIFLCSLYIYINFQLRNIVYTLIGTELTVYKRNHCIIYCKPIQFNLYDLLRAQLPVFFSITVWLIRASTIQLVWSLASSGRRLVYTLTLWNLIYYLLSNSRIFNVVSNPSRANRQSF